jgi:hypothetical protein
MMIQVHTTHKNELKETMKFEVKPIHYFQR